ncbi:MAG TPA: copper resistance protein CopC [Gemmatimonadaceae bacterium]
MQFPKLLRHPVAAISAAIMVLATPAVLFAHAHLVRSSPAANAVLDSAPATLGLWFSERPEPRFTAIQLLDSAGLAVPLGAPTSGEQNGLTLAITRPLTPGRYSVVWRTAASDGHATNGNFSFRVAAARGAPPAPAPIVTVTPVTPTRASDASQAATTPAPIRWAELFALIVLIGATVFRLAVLHEAALPDDATLDVAARTRRVAVAALALFAVTSVARVVLQSQLVTGSGSPMAATMAVMTDTRWGHGWLVGAVGVVIALIGLFGAAQSTRAWFGVAVGAVLICVSEALTGHAAAMRHTALSIAVDVTHVLGAGAWMGTLFVMVGVGLPALGRLNPATAARAGSSLTRAYHTAAVDGVVLVVLSGVIAAFLRLPAFNALWTTDYGSWLFRKLIFVLIALAFGAYHWRRVVTPEWTDDTRRRFSRSAFGELVVGLVIIALTSILVSTSLPQ